MASGKDNLPINSDREKNGTEPLALVRGVGSGLAGEGTPGSGLPFMSLEHAPRGFVTEGQAGATAREPPSPTCPRPLCRRPEV